MLNDFRTLRVGVLCSKRAPGLVPLLRHPMRVRALEMVAAGQLEEAVA